MLLYVLAKNKNHLIFKAKLSTLLCSSNLILTFMIQLLEKLIWFKKMLNKQIQILA